MVFEALLLGVAANVATELLRVLLGSIRGEDDDLDSLGARLIGLGISVSDAEVGRLREWLQTAAVLERCGSLASGATKDDVDELVVSDIAQVVLLASDASQCPAGTDLADWKKRNIQRAELIRGNLWDCVLAALPLSKRSQLLVQVAAAITVEQGGTDRLRDDLVDLIKPLVENAAVGYPLKRPVEQPPAQMRAADLLSGEHRLVPFIDRNRALADLIEWCEDFTAARFSARVVSGAGGSGKTRLATELCHEMRLRGWIGGVFKRPDPNQTGQVDALLDATAPRLIVFDYADTQPEAVKDFFDGANSRLIRKSAPVRVVLIVRRQDTTDDPTRFFISKVERTLLADTEPLRLSEPKSASAVGFDADQRAALYETASNAVAQRVGKTAKALSAPDDLEDEHWGSPLLVVARALLNTTPTVDEPPATRWAKSAHEVLDELLIREERIWEQADCPQTRPDLRRRAVGIATMFAPNTEADAMETLLFSPINEHVQSTASWLRTLYPGPRYANPLTPDLLAERLIHREATESWIQRAIDPERMLKDPYPMETLTRAMETSDALRDVVAPIFNDALTDIINHLKSAQSTTVERCSIAVATALQSTRPALEQLPDPFASAGTATEGG